MNQAGKSLIVASLLAAVAFYFFDLGLAQAPGTVVLKGAAVGLLAVLAMTQNRSLNGWLIALVMALGAAGDVAIERSVLAGALFFLVGHGAAICLYLRNRREVLTASQMALALLLLPAVPAIAYALPADRIMAPLVGIYALGLAGMAATAWTSRFPRYRVGLGAMLFVLSDLMIFAGMGPLAHSAIPGMTIWPAYYIGQYMVCLGVLETLGKDQASA